MLSALELKNFRSHPHIRLSLSENTNVIIGPNRAGKTNILEAVLVLVSGKSYRGSDEDLIKKGCDFAKIDGEISFKKRSFLLENKNTILQKSFTIQGKSVKRLSFHTRLPVVVFEPEFMQIIMRGPGERRDYIDGVLSRTKLGYQALLGRYKRTLAQRNTLLKSNHPTEDQLFVWDIKLSELATQIINYRLKLLENFENNLPGIYSNLASTPQIVHVSYLTKTNIDDYTNNLLSGLRSNLSRDKERGFTSLGPHRDDISFSINNKNASLYASRGEIRTLLLSVKIYELQLVEETRDSKPILLLDDVFSELDTNRQTKLLEYFKNNQVIITTTNVTPLMKGVSGKIIEL